MKRKLLDLDAEIAALEAAGKDEDSSDSNSDSDSNSESESDTFTNKNSDQMRILKKASSGIVETVDKKGEVIILKSSLSDEAAIAPLSLQHLPAAGCGNTTKKEKKKPKKLPRTAAEEDKSGLEKTVMEMLRNYQPSSSERRPFWCRICRFQGSSEEELMSHRDSEFHVLASQKERKLSYCKLCKIQFTSPDQLKEHLRGAKHKSKLEYAMQNQHKAKSAHGVKFERI